MAKKRITVPKIFDELIKTGDIERLKAVFDKCEINATIGYNKESVLSAFHIPDELVRWLVSQGADIHFADHIYKRTPLHLHAMRKSGDITVFLELGADINATDTYGNTPLHFAAGSSYNVLMVKQLLQKGANPIEKNEDNQTPLAAALAGCNNIDIVNMVKIADILLHAGDCITKDMQKSVSRIGKHFEFHKHNFKKETLDKTVTALNQLYKLFDVAPVEERQMHDGVSPIIVKATKWQQQHDELWALLVPSSGHAKTVQGEVIRITGKVSREILDNGSINWGDDFREMLNALAVYFTMGVSLDSKLLEETAKLAKKLRGGNSDGEETDRMCELAVKWVLLNQKSILLEKPDYRL